jgi:hypothetical protein
MNDRKSRIFFCINDDSLRAQRFWCHAQPRKSQRYEQIIIEYLFGNRRRPLQVGRSITTVFSCLRLQEFMKKPVHLSYLTIDVEL